MEIQEAMKIIAHLGDGRDPVSGEKYPHDSPYQNADAARALYLANEALRRWADCELRRRSLPSQTGTPWSPGEEETLVRNFESGIPIEQLASSHNRTVGAIRARLVKLGKLSEEEFVPRFTIAGRSERSQ